MLIFANRQLTLRLSRIKKAVADKQQPYIYFNIQFYFARSRRHFWLISPWSAVFRLLQFSLLLKLPRVTPLFSCRLRLRAVMPVGTSGIAAFPLFGYHLFDLWRTNLWLRGFGKYLIFLSSPLLYHIVCAMSIVFLINVENIYKIRAYHYLLLTK